MPSFFPSEQEARHRLLHLGIDVDQSYIRLIVETAPRIALDLLSATDRLCEQAKTCNPMDRPRIAREMRGWEMTPLQIAEAFGVRRSLVYDWLNGSV